MIGKELIPAFEIVIPQTRTCIRFVQLSEYTFTAGEVVPAHKHQMFEVRFMKSGKIISRINKVTYHTSKNYCFYVRPGDNLYHYTSEPTVMYHVGFVVTKPSSTNYFRNMSVTTKLAKQQISIIRDIWTYPSTVFKCPPKITLPLERIFSGTRNKGRNDYQEIREHVALFITSLYEELYKLNSSQKLLDINLAGLDSRTRNVIKASIAYIKTNYARRMDLDYLSRKINFSKRHLERLFTEVSGCTLNEYLMKVRTLKASILLKQPGYKIDSAIKESGFNNIERFYRYFKRYIGISPGRFKTYHSNIKRGNIRGPILF